MTVITWFMRNFLRILEWILYLILLITSLFITRGVMEKFDSGATSIRQYEETIKYHPTIIVCPSWTHGKPDQIRKYLRDLTMSYTIVSSHKIEDKITLNIGKNNLTNSGETIDLKEIYTDMAMFCYIITSTRKVDKWITMQKGRSSSSESSR